MPRSSAAEPPNDRRRPFSKRGRSKGDVHTPGSAGLGGKEILSVSEGGRRDIRASEKAERERERENSPLPS